MTEAKPRSTAGSSDSEGQMSEENREGENHCVGMDHRREVSRVGIGLHWIDAQRLVLTEIRSRGEVGSAANRAREGDRGWAIRWRLEVSRKCASCPCGAGQCVRMRRDDHCSD
jgi:hypothetical protein